MMDWSRVEVESILSRSGNLIVISDGSFQEIMTYEEAVKLSLAIAAEIAKNIGPSKKVGDLWITEEE